VLVDDGNSAVSLLGVLPVTGGLTRLVDKRRVRRDRADIFCTVEEGIKGRRALEWNLVDELSTRSSFDDTVKNRALALAETSDRPEAATDLKLPRLERALSDDALVYESLRVDFDREAGLARLKILGPEAPPPATLGEWLPQAMSCWPLQLARSLDDALLYLRANETRLGLLVLTTEGDLDAVKAHDRHGGESALPRAGDSVESEVLARLSAWYNRIFQRPNAVGEDGALKRYGSGVRPSFDPERV
jgi:benzoyl-CoA-dihydrodiol lyase